MRFLAGTVGLLAPLLAAGQGTITGHVKESTGLGVAGALVASKDSAVTAITDASGAFRLRNVAEGPSQISVRRLGFRPVVRDVDVRRGAVLDLIIPVEPLPTQLPQVTVAERRVGGDGWLAGFHDRVQKGYGRFITRKQIDASPSSSLTDLLRFIPGVQVIALRSLNQRATVRLRGARCPPLVFIDGYPAAAAEFDLDAVRTNTLEGVEVYTSMATVPAELMGSLEQYRCGVVAIWSRALRPTLKAPRKGPRTEQNRTRAGENSPVYSAAEVDSVARIDSTSFAPVYPDALWQAGTEGVTRVEFVVDSLGQAEMQFFTVISSPSPEFTDAIRDALTNARFAPAVKGGERVRQLVQLPVLFTRTQRPPAETALAIGKRR